MDACPRQRACVPTKYYRSLRISKWLHHIAGGWGQAVVPVLVGAARPAAEGGGFDTHAHTHTHTRTHTERLSLSLTHRRSHTHTHAISLSLTLSLSHTHTTQAVLPVLVGPAAEGGGFLSMINTR